MIVEKESERGKRTTHNFCICSLEFTPGIFLKALAERQNRGMSKFNALTLRRQCAVGVCQIAAKGGFQQHSGLPFWSAIQQHSLILSEYLRETSQICRAKFNFNSCISDAVDMGIDCSECLNVNAMLFRHCVVYIRIRMLCSIIFR